MPLTWAGTVRRINYMGPQSTLPLQLDNARYRARGRALLASGFGVTVLSLYLAFLARDATWYTPFVLGTYLLFGASNHLVQGRSTLLAVFSYPKHFLRLYLLLTMLTFVIDLPLGRLLGDFWTYPSFDTLDQVIHVWLLGYPLALLSAVETLWFFLHLFRCHNPSPPPVNWRTLYFRVFALTALVLLCTAVYLRLVDKVHLTRQLMFFLLFLGALGFDATAFYLRKPSLIGSIMAGAPHTALYTALCVPIIGLLHEFPNTYAHEWIYQNIPFVHKEILGVNLLVLSAGWFFLTIMPLSLVHILLPSAILPATSDDS